MGGPRATPLVEFESACNVWRTAYDTRVVQHNSLVWLVWALFGLLPGCVSGGLDLQVRAVSTRAPANVAVYLDVSEAGEPVLLEAEQVVLFEDDHRLDPSMTQQVLLDQELVVYHHTVLLVDNSGATDDLVRSELGSAIAMFAEEVTPAQPLSVYAYDGREQLTLVAEFPRAKLGPGKRLTPPGRLVPKDLSRNLNGAVLLGAKELERRLSGSGKPLGVGTLVIFAAGADLAGRTDSQAVTDWLHETHHRVLAIGYGEQSHEVEAFGKDGYYDAVAQDTISLAFEEAGHHVQNHFARGHLLGYCSPARSGERSLRIEVQLPGEQGARTAGATTRFSAQGFRAGCDPKALPRFSEPVGPTD
jgi:hypothetical protein